APRLRSAGKRRARGLPARHAGGWFRRRPDRDAGASAGQFHAHAARTRRLPACPRTARPARQGGGALLHHQARALAPTATEVAQQVVARLIQRPTYRPEDEHLGLDRAVRALLQTQALAVLLARSRQIKWLRNTYRTYSVCS